MSRRKVKVRAREEEAWKLRRQGHTFNEIARLLGVSDQTASNYVHAAFARWRELADREVVEMARMDLARLDDLLKALLPGIRDGDVPAVNAAVKILERKSKLLGLDKPQKVEVAGAAADSPLELKAQLEQLLSGSPVGPSAQEGDDAAVDSGCRTQPTCADVPSPAATPTPSDSPPASPATP